MARGSAAIEELRVRPDHVPDLNKELTHALESSLKNVKFGQILGGMNAMGYIISLCPSLL